MEAAKFASSTAWNWATKHPLRRPVATFPHSVRASSSCSSASRAKQRDGYRGPQPKRDWVVDWVSNNDDVVRSLPIYVGGVALFAVLFNRTVSGIAPVADAGSSQSRADLLTLGLAVSNILAGLVWMSIRPKSISVVVPEGVECSRVAPHMPDFVVSELEWFWESLSGVTCCKSLVVVYDNECILQTGVAAKSCEDGEAVDVDAAKLIQGSIYQGILKSGSQRYFANLSLYPAKSELPFLPPNMQAVISQPLGNRGIAIIGGDTIRGFSTADQSWISLIGDKLDATLTKLVTGPASLANDRWHRVLGLVTSNGI
ncbi:hypothetical protein V2J09_003712 [Rumex salicifolius]